MRRSTVPVPPVLPLLDRLIDEDPTTETPMPTGGAEIARRIRAAIARDLEVLLGTRPRLVGPPWAGPEPSATIVDFGLPPARGTNLATDAGRKEYARAVEAAIARFEPRLREVRVVIEPGAMPTEPLRMIIDARPAVGDPMRLEASWSPGSGRVRVGEGGP